MNAVLPAELMEILHAPYPETIAAGLRWASLDMLKDLYRENPQHPKVQMARSAMETAISEWNDEQTAEFLLQHLFQPPQSTDLQSKSPAELRQILAKIYNYLFVE